jgi:hypothetical protein
MTAEELRAVFALADAREQKHYAWLRQLLVLASGALTVLVALRAGAQSTGAALFWLRGAWVSLGIAIVFGAFSLHGEVWMARELVRLTVEENKQRNLSGSRLPSPSVARLPARYIWSERLFYTALLAAVVSLVLYAVLHDVPTPGRF